MVYLNLRSRTFRDVESFCSEIVGYLRLQTTVFPTSVTATGTYGGVELEGKIDRSATFSNALTAISKSLPDWSWMNGKKSYSLH